MKCLIKISSYKTFTKISQLPKKITFRSIFQCFWGWKVEISYLSKAQKYEEPSNRSKKKKKKSQKKGSDLFKKAQ